jgi:hypothetical protein
MLADEMLGLPLCTYGTILSSERAVLSPLSLSQSERGRATSARQYVVLVPGGSLSLWYYFSEA